MGYTATGQWVPDQDIAARAGAIAGKDSAIMRAARTDGMRTANRRGVANSSMGIGAAQAAALGVAVPIASQEAQQQHQTDTNLSTIAAQERAANLQAMVQLSGDRSNSLAATLANDKIPAGARDAAQRSITDTYTANMDWMQRLYGYRLPWGTQPVTQPPATAVSGIGAGLNLPFAG